MYSKPTSPVFRFGAALAGAILLAGFACGGAHAATLNVNTTNTVPTNDGLCGLREAIRSVNTRTATGSCPAGDGFGDAIFLPPGNYTVSAELVITRSLKIFCNGPGACNIDVGNFTGALVRMRSATAGEPSLILNKITLRQHDGNTGNVSGIIAESGILNLVESAVTGFEGRGVSILGAANGYFQKCAISNNIGYGISMESSSDIHVTSSTVTGNGFGVYIGNGGVISQANTISNNQLGVFVSNGFFTDGSDGAAGSTISNSSGVGVYAGAGSSISLTNTTIRGNLDRGVSAYENSIVNLIYCTIDGNKTSGNGGGVQVLAKTDPNLPPGFVGINGTTISNNSAGLDGGGLYVTGPIKIFNSTISTNSARRGGGAYHLSGTDTQTNAYFLSVHSTFAFNRALEQGGGIYQVAGVNACDFSMSIVARNTAPSYPDVSSGNIISERTLWGFDTGFNGSHSNDLLGDPLLGPLMDNAGPHRVKTHALLKGSKAIDRFQSALSPAEDSRGFPRPPTSGLWDLGSYEVGPLETELLTVIAKSSDSHVIQGSASLSNSAGTLLSANAVGDYVTYAVAVPEPGDYRIGIGAMSGPNRAIVELATSPGTDQYTPIGSFDMFRPGYLPNVYSLNFPFTQAGIKYFRLKVTGRNGANTQGYICNYDFITVSKI